MKPQLSEANVADIMEHLLERFGEPIGGAQGDRQGVPNKGGKKRDMGNRGFGAKLAEAAPAMCDQCGGMMKMEGDTCSSCGAMSPHVEPPIGGGGHVVPSPAGAAAPVGGAIAITVKSGPAGGGGTGGGKFAQGLKVKDMAGIPATGSGRGSAAPKGSAPAAPATPKLAAPMPTELDEDETESKEDAQQRLGFDIDHDGEIGEPAAHRAKVLGDKSLDQSDLAGAEDMDEYGGLDQEAPPSGGSSPPPSGGSSGGSSPPPKPPTSGGSSSPPPKPPSSGGGSSSPPPSSGMDEEEMNEDMDLDEVTPPGRERQVKALKKKGNIDNPWAVAWASYNKSHKKKGKK